MSDIKAIQDEILATTKGLFEGLKGTTEEQKEKLMRFSTRLDDIEAEMRRPDQLPQRRELGGIAGYKTPGERFTEEKGAIEDFRRNGRVRLDIGGMWPQFEEKTLIDSAAVGFSTPGVIGATRIQSDIVPAARRRLTVRDLLRSTPVTTGQLDFIRENSWTSAASPQTEGEAKGESALTVVIDSEKIRTIAHWIPASVQVLDDVPELRRFIDSTMIWGLKVKEELELIAGDGLGDHLTGLATAATAYSGTYTAANDTKLDVLRHAICELEVAEENCTGFIINPIDAHRIDLLKTEDGGTANKGAYLVSDPLGGALTVKTYWGRPTVITTAMTAGRFLAGDFSKALIGDRMDATIDISMEHSDFFIKNKCVIRAEERLALAILRAGAFRYGSY